MPFLGVESGLLDIAQANIWHEIVEGSHGLDQDAPNVVPHLDLKERESTTAGEAPIAPGTVQEHNHSPQAGKNAALSSTTEAVVTDNKDLNATQPTQTCTTLTATSPTSEGVASTLTPERTTSPAPQDYIALWEFERLYPFCPHCINEEDGAEGHWDEGESNGTGVVKAAVKGSDECEERDDGGRDWLDVWVG